MVTRREGGRGRGRGRGGYRGWRRPRRSEVGVAVEVVAAKGGGNSRVSVVVVVAAQGSRRAHSVELAPCILLSLLCTASLCLTHSAPLHHALLLAFRLLLFIHSSVMIWTPIMCISCQRGIASVSSMADDFDLSTLVFEVKV